MKRQNSTFPVIGIGASAGGVDALKGLFEPMPADTGIAFVVVTHLSPDRESMLGEILSRFTAMPVQDASDGLEVQPNHVYVLPAHAVLGFSDGCLRMRSPREGIRERRPIDIFLSALAKDKRELSGAVILSGGDADGTLGVKAVKERGGLTMAQVADGHPPQHEEMPESAISTGLIDFAVPVGGMARRLVEFARSFSVLEAMARNAVRGDDQGISDAAEEIYALVRAQMGHDFSRYKKRTFLRRVQRRMQVNQLDAIETYVELLRRDPKEVSALFRDLLINVTNFFRDAEAFGAFADQIVPNLFEGRGADETVRVWVPGCATGEEVFSIAMVLREHMDTLRNVPRVQLFATDIDERALGVARAAQYPEALLDSVSEERRNRFFVPDGGSWVVAKEIRDMCIFSPHSVLRDPPFSRIDLVSCRNLLIYFGADAQNQVIPTFHYALRPGGYLFLGSSEGVSQFDELFAPVDKKHRLFRARDDGGLPHRLPLVAPGIRSTLTHLSVPRGLKGLAITPLRQGVEAFVLDRHAPPHVVVNTEGDIVYYGARTGKYFEAPAGMPNRQLLFMARKGLRLDLRSAFREAVENGQRVDCHGVEFENDDGRIQQLAITVEPLSGMADERLLLVIFHDYGPAISAEQARLRPRGNNDASFELERELRDTRDRLQATIEEYETALEELKSSNEELVSVNEELQSTNEELEASKEELQALNEELFTVNGELHSKMDVLDATFADLQNVFEVTDIAVIFLDRDLVIRLFTPAAGKIFRMLSSDRGRPLTDLSHRLDYPQLFDDLRGVLASGEMIERQIAEMDGNQHFLIRITPYRDHSGAAEGVAVAAIDVTGLAEAETHQRTLIAELNHRVKNMLAIVMAIAGQMRQAYTSLDDFGDAFDGRLAAMAGAYELLSRENWMPVKLEEIATRELEPFGLHRVTIASGGVALDPRQAISLGMVLHELATNAAKYGALSNASGQVSIVATSQQDAAGHQLALGWKETGGPPVSEPSKPGFGMRLVRNEMRYSMKGTCEFAFTPEGLEVTLHFRQPGHGGEDEDGGQ
ncbi:CheR family methyltransferase [Novosphingobium sp. P6W]|uniref:CheR family methyltransferase n=1 Tax=Novosphingobium sp. P6W TaxID=1609758 RepID=UPI0005C2FAB8|nr:CheR family methyltransferase [Novosphingobium sp. P6W]AXB80733.1 chemotaxis protein CheR [Novosphingobium sp. P6W]KIS29544.1 chemotaxis protein CheR [Novosphingobium sp. P6W]